MRCNQLPMLAFLLTCFFAAPPILVHAEDDDALRSSVKAPPNMTKISSTLGGSYFVDAKLAAEAESLEKQLKALRGKIAKGQIGRTKAIQQLDDLGAQLQKVRGKIEKAKQLVSAFQVFRQRQEKVFALGDERLVIITGDKVKVRGWEGPGIKCVLEKIIVAKKKPDDKEFDEIRVEHQLGVADSIVGNTRAAQEATFLESEKGKQMTPDQLAGRQKFVAEIAASYVKYAAFQGKECNTLQLKGLTHEQGNRNLSLEIRSPGGGSTHSSRWQRHASLTVFIPKSKWLAVRGCYVGLDIADIETNLLLTTSGSRDRDYAGSFEVRSVVGNVVVDQAPVRKLGKISGDVDVTATVEFVNSGTHHEGGLRTAFHFTTAATQIDDVAGDFRGRFLRTDLSLGNIRGTIDVENDFGATSLVGDASLAAGRAHRVISESGEIHLSGTLDWLTQQPLYAHTLCGSLQTNLRRETLDDISITTGTPRRGWSGFVTPNKGQPFSMSKFERPGAALENSDRAAGLDLISKGGTVTIMASDQ